MTKQEIELIPRAIDAASNRGETNRDEAMLAVIEATLRDLLGQRHGVWRWHVPQHLCRRNADGIDVAAEQRTIRDLSKRYRELRNREQPR